MPLGLPVVPLVAVKSQGLPELLQAVVHVSEDTGALAPDVKSAAFMISELKTAFQIGFLLYIPFLIIDMVVSSVLLSMGMMMLPPILISLPFKILLFVMVDGWHLVVGSMVKSFY